MKYFLLILLLIVAPLSAFADRVSDLELYARDPLTCGGVHPEWTRCNSDADCLLVPNACGASQIPAAVSFQKDVAECAKAGADKTMDCTNPRFNGSRGFTAFCVNRLCRAKPKR